MQHGAGHSMTRLMIGETSCLLLASHTLAGNRRQAMHWSYG